MSESDKNLLEKRSLTDPFLKEAMDGFEAHPSALKIISKRILNAKKSRNSFFGSRTIAVLLVVSAVYVIALFSYNNNNDFQSEISSTQDLSREVEVIPEEIDSFVIVNETDQILVSEIVENKVRIEQTASNKHDSIVLQEDKIIIDENSDDIAPDEIEYEVSEKMTTVYAPSIYIEELYVIDYREIDRKRKNIHYTKYVLSGISANFEDAGSKNNQELVEKEVEIPYIDYLESSMYYFSRKKFKKALNRYLTIIEQYPTDLNAYFYGAHCYFNMKKYSEALSFFETCLKLEKEEHFVAFRQEVKWYTVKTLIKLDRTEEASEILDSIIIEGLFYTKDAILLKKEL